MSEDFFKFPSTPHLATLPGVEIRGDKVLSPSERDEFLRHELTVEEKVDGANLGISFDTEGNVRFQNRGAYLSLPGTGQWKKLSQWITPRSDALFESLTDQYILFGEWCYAQHSVFYDRLPDWFLAFDIYDREHHRFLSSARRDILLEKLHVFRVPVLARGLISFSEIKGLLSQSKLCNQPAEGVYLRADSEDWLEKRAKLVRPAFIQSMENHWSRSTIKSNKINMQVPE
ncbi:MAG TPA: RNA ligase family protein [Verrucomicrobiota bacterium]|nr:RNA ligase family protein [Verrucomicrobiota bacterium]